MQQPEDKGVSGSCCPGQSSELDRIASFSVMWVAANINDVHGCASFGGRSRAMLGSKHQEKSRFSRPGGHLECYRACCLHRDRSKLTEIVLNLVQHVRSLR